MSEEKNGKVKVTFEVEINEALLKTAKDWMPHMGWMGPWRAMGPWRGHGMMGGQMPWGMGHGMTCPECGEPMVKPSKEEIIEMLERKKKRLEEAIDHINKETEKLENKPEEKM